ncbi:unnamed protein product, partial [Candidula unifasciata]
QPEIAGVMAAASSANMAKPFECEHSKDENAGDSQTAENNQESGTHTAQNDRPSSCVDTGVSSDKEKNGKSEQASKKFVDAPPPVTNAWTKRGASLSSEKNQVQPSSELQEGI